jgi:hypothetical protein
MFKMLYCDYHFLKGLLCVQSRHASTGHLLLSRHKASLVELVVGPILDTRWQGHGIYFVTSTNPLQLYK